MCRAISFFSMSNDAQFESGAIQDTRILTGSAFDAPCVRSEIAATSPISQDRTSHICPSHAGPARKLTIATFADKPQPQDPQQSFMELIRCPDMRAVPQVRELDELGVADALGGRATQLGIVSKLLRKIRGR